MKIFCDLYASAIVSQHFDTISFFIPSSKQKQFELNPHEYILQACGAESELILTPTNQQKHRWTNYVHDQPSLSANITDTNSISNTNETDIPDADELELSSLPLIQREEIIDKILHIDVEKAFFIPSPLMLACLGSCGERIDYENIVKILLESHLVEFDGLNHESILRYVLNYMKKHSYGHFQSLLVYRDTDVEGPSNFLFYQFEGFLVNQNVQTIDATQSDSSTTLSNESLPSDDDNQISSDTPIIIRCFLTILVLRNIFYQYPRWDFHLLRENIEENFNELEETLGFRPTILYPDGEILSYRKRSDLTWEIIVKYRLASDTGRSIYMQVDYYFFESFGDPFADAFINLYQSPFYLSCLTDSTVMMEFIFDSFFKRRHLHCWENVVAQKQLEDCFGRSLK